MPSLIQRIRILLSSPGNLQMDREAVRKVADQINSDSGRREGFHIEVVSWETHTRPSVGSHPQEIINEQFPDDIDIYIGLLGSYFGTPTKKYKSGTEEEFRLAYKWWEENGFPEILFYFSNAKIDPDEIDAEQLALCKSFRKEIGDLGVKYEKYDDLTEFQVTLHRHLSEAVYEVLSEKDGANAKFEPQPEYRELLPNYERLVIDNPNIAVGDMFEEATQLLSDHTTEMRNLTQDLNRTVFNLDKQSKRLIHAQQSNNDKGVFEAVAAVVDLLGQYKAKFRLRLPAMRASMEDSLILTQRAINLIKLKELNSEFPLSELVKPVADMKAALAALGPLVEQLNEVFDDWPELEGDLSNHILRIKALHKDFREYVDQSVALIETIEHEIE